MQRELNSQSDGRGLLQRTRVDQVKAYCAGLDPKGIHPPMIQMMEDEGISLDGQSSISVKDDPGKVDIPDVLSVCGHAEKNYPSMFLNQGVHNPWEFEDLSVFKGSEEVKLAKFQDIRDQIKARIRQSEN